MGRTVAWGELLRPIRKEKERKDEAGAISMRVVKAARRGGSNIPGCAPSESTLVR